MTGINSVTVMGNLTKDPELKFTTGGAAVCNLRMAINRKYKSGNELKEDVCYLTVVVWRESAEACGEYLKKGSPVCVQGRLQSRSWEKDDKTKVTVLEVVAERVIFLDRKDSSKTDTPDHGEPEKATTSEEEIPF